VKTTNWRGDVSRGEIGTWRRDMPLVRAIARDAAGSNYRFSTVVLGIVKSAPFQMNTKGPETAQQTAR
jgi:hypothetical protein